MKSTTPTSTETLSGSNAQICLKGSSRSILGGFATAFILLVAQTLLPLNIFANPAATSTTAKTKTAVKNKPALQTHPQIPHPEVLQVFPNGSAAGAGIKSGDTAIKVNTTLVVLAEDFIREVHLQKAMPVVLGIARGKDYLRIPVKPNDAGQIGVRVSNMWDAVVGADEKYGAPTCKTAKEISALLNPTGAPPVVTSLKPGTRVKVLYEEPVTIESSGKTKAICKIRLDKNTEGAAGDSFRAGDWYTLSAYLKPVYLTSSSPIVQTPITYEQANSLKADMTQNDVERVLRGEYNLVGHNRNAKGVLGDTLLWQNPDGSYLCCNFENRRLVYKSAFLLK